MSSLILGVSGSVAAYKAPELIRLFAKDGISVVPVLTANARRFVAPHALAAVSHSPVYDQLFDGNLGSPHLELGRSVDALVIAPASANVIAKLANGHGDDLLSTLFLSFEGPRLIVPAMHTEMVENKAVEANLAVLKSSGVVVLGPVVGDLAFGDVGNGRMVDLPLIVAQTKCLLATDAPNLQNVRVVITAGGTEVPIDPVRVITNRSTGKLGHMLASIAAGLGAEVTLITTRESEIAHPEIHSVWVKTPDEMNAAAQRYFPSCDALIMAAAVSDFTVEMSSEKVQRKGPLVLSGSPTVDILANLGRQKTSQRVVGFCLESEPNLLKRAAEKLVQKHCDVMIANTLSAMGADRRSATVLFADASRAAVSITDQPLFDFGMHLLREVFWDKMAK